MDERVAVARSNGNVEIWNVSSGWHMERQIPGGEELSVETLVSVATRSLPQTCRIVFAPQNTCCAYPPP